ncbi:MAG TPA: LysM peptidoglycan-binding domain-containing protein [Anaerolineales bacterium]|nr:LysM peptidoglycan-binding domain-containing protein [Anaerolineales bacterium]
MNVKLSVFLCSITLILLFLGIALPFNGASAAPRAQGFVTATPGPDGRITYIVAEGDNCGQVALLHGITVQQLRQFNTRLDENCTLTVGQQLVVGLASLNEPTAGPAPTLPSPTVTATPVSGTTEVCVLLFEDMNGDAVRQETEFGIAGGAVSLTNLNGSYSQTQDTSSAVDPDTLEPVRACFVDVPGGEYNVSMAVPDEYNPTMLLSYTLTVKAGDRANISFGAQSKTITASETTEPQEANRSSFLGIFGFLLLLGGAGLGYYAYRSSQPKSKLKGSPLMKRE